MYSRYAEKSGFGVDVRSSYTYTAANNINPTTVTTALNDEANLQGLAFGGGLRYGSGGGFSVGLDYAYRYMGVLGGTNFFTLEVGW